MKSKKKLIYKLHQNLYQNPFKKIDEVSFRNAGTVSYDYNKLKSIRAISLKGLGSEEHIADKSPSDWKQKYDLKMNMVAIKEEIQQKAQQALICNKKKILTDKSLITMQPKKLNVRTLLKEKHFDTLRPEEQSSSNFHTLENHPTNSDEDQINQNYHHTNNEPKQVVSDHQLPRLNHQKHSRNVSLPLINSHKESPQKSAHRQSPKKQLDVFADEQRAKEQILRQIRLNAQEKINKQVLMSIKLKSIQNLERIARSQSEVIKIDKWKEKYAQSKNGSDFMSNGKHMSPKNLLQEIQQKLYTKELKSPHRYAEISQEQEEREVDMPQIQVAKDLLHNVTILESASNQMDPIHSYKSTVLYKQSPELLYGDLGEMEGELDQNYLSEMLSKNELQNRDFRYSQPLKLTITKLKGKKNKQNQILSVGSSDTGIMIKKKSKKNLNYKSIDPPGSDQIKEKDLQIQTGNNNDYNLWKQESPISPTQFRTKSKLYTHNNHQEELLPVISYPMGTSSRRNHSLKCKINEEHNILNKIVDYGMPQEWEHKKYGDEELGDFDMYLQNEAKETIGDQ